MQVIKHKIFNYALIYIHLIYQIRETGKILLCNSCNARHAVHVRPYSGEKLCQSCFIKSFEKKVRKNISAYDMLRSNDKIAIALSGGKDSTVLLYLLSTLEKKFPKASLFAITVDEGIDRYRDEALQNAEAVCRDLGVAHLIVSFKELFGLTVDDIAKQVTNKKEYGLTPCSYCGVLRRKALNKIAKKLKATKIATAHNLDDETQTILLNFIHGDIFRASRITPTSGLQAGMFVQRIKPLCNMFESEIALYAYYQKIKFQSVDCPYASTALRTEIREFLNKLEDNHPSVKYIIYRSFEKIRPFLKHGVNMDLKACNICGEPSSKSVCEPCKMLQRLTSKSTF